MEMYSSVKDILKLKKYLEGQKANYENIIGYNKAHRDAATFKPQRKYFAKLVEGQKQEIKFIKNKINECDHLMDILSTFPSNIILPFLAKVISIFEDKEYVYEEFFLNFNIGVERYLNTSYPMNFYAIYDADYKESRQELEKEYGNLPYYSIFQQNLLGEKVLKDIYHKETKLLENSELSEFFKDFSYLGPIVYDLIDKRLSEPKKDLQSIVNEELENLKNKDVTLKKAYKD